ncbi:MAG: cytochrome c [Planctomycetota bacterium]
MQDPTHYPVSEFGPAIPGMVIGGMGIVHVFVAQFAVGAGALLLWLERAAGRGDALARRFSDGFFLFLVLVSFVFGALTGVGMWLTAVQVSAPTIGAMVREFHWLWATEWCFFLLEVVSGYLFFRYRRRLPHRTRVALLTLYAVSSWLSLFLINGILSWQLTPGEWLQTGSLWHGFFNPSFWPSLVYRTLVAWTLAALAAVLVAQLAPAFSAAERARLQRAIAPFLAPMLVMPIVGLWFVSVLPADSRGWLLGGSVAMTMFLAIAVGASTLLGLYAVVVLWWRRVAIDRATAALLLALAFAATGAGEFVREGVRKPFTIRHVLYSNAVTPTDVARMRIEGAVADDPYPVRGAEHLPNDQLILGQRVFRRLCAVCHSIEGANGVRHLTATWTTDQLRMNLAQLQRTKSFMPPFAGTPTELEALVQWLRWIAADRPRDWPTTSGDPAPLAQIRTWLDQAGTGPGGSVEHK